MLKYKFLERKVRLIISVAQVTEPAGRPDWANFRLLGNCLLWVVFENRRSSQKFVGCLFSMVKVL
jgi:hypothetical protein